MTRIFRTLCTLTVLCLYLNAASSAFAANPAASASAAKEETAQPSAWAADSVQTAYDAGILSEHDNFDWQAPITRKHFCYLVDSTLLALGKAPHLRRNERPFDDTTDLSVRLLHQLGIIRGVAPRTFAPDEPITRADAACITARTASCFGIALPTTCGFVYEFAAANIPDYAVKDVSAVLHADLFYFAEDIFNQQRTLTVEEAVALLVRFYEIASDAIAATHAYEDALYQAMPRDKNYMISPFSLKAAFALAANGTAGETLKEIVTTFGYADLDLYNNAVRQTVQNNAANDDITFETANSVWINRDRSPVVFLESYKRVIAELFDAEADTVGNANAIPRINAWASEKSHGKIPELIDSAAFDAMLVNAVYFKGAWRSPFNKDLTADGTFTDRNGTECQIPFMLQTDTFAYSDAYGTRILKLPYESNFTMALILPGETDASPRALLNAADFNYTRVTLKMPKFRIENTFELNQTVKALGIKRAFIQELADFTPMFGPLGGYIERVFQKTYIDVDEDGTEAAAVTVITIKGGGMPPQTEPIEFTLDRPFLFAILDDCGEMLFMGEYAFAE